MTRRSLFLSTLAASAVITITLTGCSATTPTADAGTTSATNGPVSVDNCGRTVTFDTPPTRIVSLWPAITEMLISLDQTQNLVGQAFTDQSTPLPEYSTAYNTVPVLGTNSISAETLLAAQPQLVVADGEYHFDGKELPTIDSLQQLGIQVYIISSFCNGAVTTGHVTDAKTDLQALGHLTGTERTATKLATTIDTQLAQVSAETATQPAIPLAMVQFYDKDLYADAQGIYSDVVSLAGGTNIYENSLPTGQYYATVSIEDLTQKNPSTIVYLYNSEADRAQQLGQLQSALPTVSAVKTGRLIALPSTDFIGARAVDGVLELRKALTALGS